MVEAQKSKMPVPEDHPNIIYVPLAEACAPPKGFIEHFKDKWWIVHPERGVVMWRVGNKARNMTAPQFNSSEEIARLVQQKMYPWAEVRQIPSVFKKVDPKDWRDT